MKKLTKYLYGYKKECLLGPLFKLFEAALELIVPLVIAALIDIGISQNDKPYIINACIVLVILGLTGLGFSVIAQYFAAKASVGFVTKMKLGLYRHLQSLSYSDIDHLGTSTMITRMTADSSKVQTGMNLGLRLLLRSPFVVFGAMIMAVGIDRSVALHFGGVIGILSIIVFGIMLITMPMYQTVQGDVDKILKKTRENLGGARIIRAFAVENNEIQEFKEDNGLLTVAQKKAGNISALMNPLTYVTVNIGIALLIYTGALKVDSGVLTQGQVIALYNYMSQILVELVKLANLIVSISKALASASRISSIFDITSSMNYGSLTDGEGDIAVEFDSVSLKYRGSSENSLENISFTVKKGETIGIIGSTGSGKTSLVNLISRFYDATEGIVKLNGFDVKEYTRDAIVKKIRIAPQKATLFSGSIRDNILWGQPDATDEQINDALKIAQADEVVRGKGGLDAWVEAGGRNFSGGQKQRLTIARALVGSPEIIILDDSASALDYATDASLRASLKNKCSAQTVFIVSQRASSVIDANKIIVLDDGAIVGIGTHEELLKSNSVYKEIYDSQFTKEVS